MKLLSRLFFKLVPWIRWPFRSQRALIIRLDAIGDYILFRNFLQTLAPDDHWKQYRFTLLGNVAFREIAEAFDKPYVSEFIWVDTDRLNKTRYILSIVMKLKMRAFDVAIDPANSKHPVHENILLLSGSKKIVSADHNSHQFEFYRNRAFITRLTGRNDDTKLNLPFNKSEHVDDRKINVVLFPGAGHPSRRWSASLFASLISSINSEKFHFIIAGSKDDVNLGAEVVAAASVPVLDLTGKTSLPELIDLIGSCQVLVSNETSAVHIAAATGAPAVCISNGHHFGRFNPYPAELWGKIITVYSTNHSDINTIPVSSVLEAFRKLSVNSVQ